jgi:hypothetical protein
MSRSWCLAIALLVSGSMTAAAAVSNTDAVTPTSRYAKIASHADGVFRVAAKTCNTASWQRSECVNGFMGVCHYYRTTDCKTTRTFCKVSKPAPRC